MARVTALALLVAATTIVQVDSASPRVATERLAARRLPPSAATLGGRRQGGFGGGAPRALVAQFDKDGDKRLNAEERRAARAFVEASGNGRGGRGGRFGGTYGPAEPGPRLTPSAVRSYQASVPLYDPGALRTVFFTFTDADWHEQLIAFHNTDVDVPATMVVDGRTYAGVGLHYRGASSFSMVPRDRKHSINVSVDFTDDAQSLGGYRTLNLLNSHEDPTYLRTVLYLQAARDYVPAPKANYLRAVINGESWGIYASQQQFNKEFVAEWFNTTGGARWKVPGSPGGRGGLEYWEDGLDRYKRTFEIKTKDDPKSWQALVTLTRVLNTTPVESLERALAPMLDIDETLKFLALDNVFVNGDGYWVRASDYAIYLDPKGVFHILPHDANEIFSSGFGPGMRGGGGGPMLDPLVGVNDAGKPLRSRLLAVPTLRARYLGYVREIATKWLDWKTLEPLVTRNQALIAADVKADTRKLDSFDDFSAGVAEIKNFVAQRRAYLLAFREGER